MDGWIDGWVGGWMDGRIDGWVGGWVDGWLDGWTDRRVGGLGRFWVDGWMDGWDGRDGSSDRWMFTSSQHRMSYQAETNSVVSTRKILLFTVYDTFYYLVRRGR